MLPLVLASSSDYRRELLQRLKLPFICSSPEIDEQAHQGETPMQLVRRLAEEKARAVRDNFSQHLIGSSRSTW